MPGSQFYGYDFQSSQPCERLGGKLKLGALRDTSHIDSWLLDYFAINADRLSHGETRADGGEVALARAVFERALVLYGELVRVCGLPSFDRGSVLRVEASEDEARSYLATIALPVIDNLPFSLFRRLFRDSLLLVQTRLALEPSRDAADALFAEINESIVAKLGEYRQFGTSTLPVCELAFREGIPFRHIGGGVMRLGCGANSRLLHRSAIEGDSSVGAWIANDKRVTVRVLGAAGFPVPEHIPVDSREAAVEAARQLGWPLVVKPADLSQSAGVTVNITTASGLAGAYDRARATSQSIVVERHVPGVCHRLMVAGGRFMYAVSRLAKGVKGDGRSTVAELVALANAEQTKLPPWKRLREFPLDEMALGCLAEQDLALESVPADGFWVSLRPITAGEWGGEVEELTEQIHPDNVQLALGAARTLGMSVAGVDLMTTDISRPWHENGAVINEVNFRPQLSAKRRELADRLMPALLEGDGRIPVHLVTGEGDLLDKARQLKGELSKQGVKCHLTSARYSEDREGVEMVLPFATLFERSLALTLRPDVHGLILVGRAAELLKQGLAVDRLESAYVFDDDPQRGERLICEISARFPVGSCRRISP